MRNSWGQYITFSVEKSDDRFSGFTYVAVTQAMRTIKQICKKRKLSDARYVADINGIRSVESKLRLGRLVRVPDHNLETLVVNVLAGDQPPRITRGYGKITTVDRSERTGLSIFTGYDPIGMEVPIRFEALNPEEAIFSHADGIEIEDRISKLEQMAGRGQFRGAAVGQSAIIRVSTTGNDGADDVVPLIPLAYQRYDKNPSGPVWWISEIDWDADALRNHKGQRIRQLATISLIEYVAPKLDSAADRNKSARPRVKTYTNRPPGGFRP